jgi:putative Holliday junction resolvase
MRVVALDLGSRRIGVAVSDPTGTLASPYQVLKRAGDPAADHAAIANIVAEMGAELVVVGLPLSLDGSEGPAARQARAETEVLATAVAVPVELHDERLTTVAADRSMQRSGKGGKARRKVVDQAAATVLLQSWLDRGRGSPR